MSRRPSTFRRIFLAPLLIGVASLVGLVSALAGEGPADWISWLGLTIPIAVLAWALATRRG